MMCLLVRLAAFTVVGTLMGLQLPHAHAAADYVPLFMRSCMQVQFLGAVTKQQPFMIVTEYMCGGSLADLFKGARFPNLWRSVQIALDMARGMAYLHSRTPQAVIHRDLKVGWGCVRCLYIAAGSSLHAYMGGSALCLEQAAC